MQKWPDELIIPSAVSLLPSFGPAHAKLGSTASFDAPYFYAKRAALQ